DLILTYIDILLTPVHTLLRYFNEETSSRYCLTPYACTYVVTAEGYRALSPRFIAGKSADSFCYFTPTYVVTNSLKELRQLIELAPHTPTYVVTPSMLVEGVKEYLAPHTPTYVVTSIYADYRSPKTRFMGADAPGYVREYYLALFRHPLNS